ncbi:MAG TPA: FAD-binding oxidoreductase [Stellaceae bacterium]|nr:FAD-binding oxidoreductase [Stellaceae bacterium]
MSEARPWPQAPTARRRLITMDGSFTADAALQRPDRYAFLSAATERRPAIARGAGFSFAAASFGAGAVTVDFTAFDRILAFDAASGIVEMEAGARLGALFCFLTARGFYLPVQPGHFSITVGGAIAADVHGKNPAREGTFLAQVRSLRLFHPAHGMVEASTTQNGDLFRATCGGYGLTGVIVSARLEAQPIPGDTLTLAIHPVATAREGAERLREWSTTHDLVYAWHDFARPGVEFGRGAAIVAKFSGKRGVRTEAALRPSRFSPERRARLPLSLITPWTVRCINRVYSMKLRRSEGPTTLAAALYPTASSEPYLALFGRSGFHETQAIIPDARYGEYVDELRALVQRSGVTIALGVAKPFAGASDHLRFTGDGISLALHVARDARASAFLAELDRLVIAAGARPNIIKDSRLPRAIVETAYPDYQQFRAALRRWDPERLFRSELSARLGL